MYISKKTGICKSGAWKLQLRFSSRKVHAHERWTDSTKTKLPCATVIHSGILAIVALWPSDKSENIW